jgi:hypothetical protein
MAIPLTSVPNNFTIRHDRIESTTTAVLLGIEHLGSLSQAKSLGYTAKNHGAPEPAHNPKVLSSNLGPVTLKRRLNGRLNISRCLYPFKGKRDNSDIYVI